MLLDATGGQRGSLNEMGGTTLTGAAVVRVADSGAATIRSNDWSVAWGAATFAPPFFSCHTQDQQHEDVCHAMVW